MDDRGKLSVRTARDGDRVLLVEIGDNGPGSPEAAARILEPFFTPSRSAGAPAWGSTSAGASVVQRHHGDLRFTSTPATPLPGPAAAHPERVTPAPWGSDRLAQVPTMGGDSPDHEHVQGDDQQRPERVVRDEQEVGDGAEHGQGDGRGPAQVRPDSSPQPAKATSRPSTRWIQPQVVASNWKV